MSAQDGPVADGGVKTWVVTPAGSGWDIVETLPSWGPVFEMSCRHGDGVWRPMKHNGEAWVCDHDDEEKP